MIPCAATKPQDSIKEQVFEFDLKKILKFFEGIGEEMSWARGGDVRQPGFGEELGAPVGGGEYLEDSALKCGY